MKPRMTLEEHREMGLALAQIRDDLLHRSVQVSNAYPKSGAESVPGRALAAAVDHIDKTRSALDNAMFNEHPNDGETTVYYPYQEDRQASRR